MKGIYLNDLENLSNLSCKLIGLRKFIFISFSLLFIKLFFVNLYNIKMMIFKKMEKYVIGIFFVIY